MLDQISYRRFKKYCSEAIKPLLKILFFHLILWRRLALIRIKIFSTLAGNSLTVLEIRQKLRVMIQFTPLASGIVEGKTSGLSDSCK